MILRGWKEAVLLAPSLTIFTKQKNEDCDVKYSAACRRCTKYIEQRMLELGCPGFVIGVSVNGQNIWTKGFGYSDIENDVPCKPDTVMRIASISKSFTMAVVAKLMEDGKLDINEPIQKYIPNFPIKKFNDKEVTITTKMLLSHLSGIRHYKNKKDKEGSKEHSGDYELEEFYSMKPYSSVSEAVDIFKDDPLLHKPGKKYLYTTHGYTLVSAVVEGASGQEFLSIMQDMFHKFGMNSTRAESTEKIIYNRARYYVRTENGKLQNVPYVDLSYKWSGGGFLSTVPDLLKFGNIMLYSYQKSSEANAPGYLKKESVRMMWTPVTKTNKKTGDESYGLGWEVYPEISEIGCGLSRDFEVLHTGGAVGASSVLYICPSNFKSNDCVQEVTENIPSGIVVAVLTNLQGISLREIARKVASEFEFLS